MRRTPGEFARIAGAISGYTGKYALEVARNAGISLNASKKRLHAFFSKRLDRRDRLHGGSKLKIKVDGVTRSRESWARHLNIVASTLRYRARSLQKRNPHMSDKEAAVAVVKAILARQEFPRRGARPGQRMKPIPQYAINGAVRGVDEWAKICEISEDTLRQRICKYKGQGKAPEAAISMYLRRVGIAA